MCALHFMILFDFLFAENSIEFSIKMKKLPTDTYVDIELFQDDLKDIDQEFIQSIQSIYKISTFWSESGYLCMTNDANYAYGDRICKWLSLQHDP